MITLHAQSMMRGGSLQFKMQHLDFMKRWESTKVYDVDNDGKSALYCAELNIYSGQGVRDVQNAIFSHPK